MIIKPGSPDDMYRSFEKTIEKISRERKEESKAKTKAKASCSVEGYYVARDCYGLGLYLRIPERYHDEGNGNDYWSAAIDPIPLPETAFPDLKWEDEPRKIRIKIEEI